MSTIPGRSPWLIKPPVLALWNALLEKVRVQYPDAFIAGGAVRDAIYKRQPRDIDVFTWLPLDQEHHQLPQDNWIDNIDNLPLEDGTKESSRLINVSRYMMYDEYLDDEPNPFVDRGLMQIVQVNPQAYEPGNMAAVVSQFGLSIQQAWYDGKEVFTLPAFDRSKRDNTVSITYCESAHEMVRLLRKVWRMTLRPPACGRLIIDPQWHPYLAIECTVSENKEPPNGQQAV